VNHTSDTMKIFNALTSSLISALICMLLFSSCDKKEKDKEIVQTEIAGKWIIKKEIFTETEDGEVKPETLTFSGNDSYIEFKDGMMKIVFLDDAEDQSWDIYTQPYTISSDSKKIIVS